MPEPPTPAVRRAGTEAIESTAKYTPRVTDAIFGDRRLVLQLRVRRFFCPAAGCSTVTFVEQISGLTSRYARRSQQATDALQDIGLALAGRAGARLTGKLGLRAGRTTILRIIRRIPEQPAIPVTVRLRAALDPLPPAPTGPLRRSDGGGLSPPLEHQRFTAHGARTGRVRHHVP